MQIVNWLALQPQESEIQALREQIEGVVQARKLRQMLVEIILHGYPWPDRADLIPCYHPSQTYRKDQWVALPIPDKQKLRPLAWRVVRITQAEIAENLIQGEFQALTLDVYGKQIHVAGGVKGARFPKPDLSKYTPEDLAGLSAWVADTYAKLLQAVLENLVSSGQLRGQFVEENFIPGKIPAIALAQLEPFFANLSIHRAWVSVDEIFQYLPELSQLKPETALALIRAALAESSYCSLGGDRWTTPALFEQLNREVPRGLPVPHISSKLNFWTAQDKQDLAEFRKKSMPTEARRALEELEIGDTMPETAPDAWLPPTGPVRLPTLNYLHITQAYFPVGHIIHVFAPDVRLAFVQFIEGEHQPFLLDRDAGLLKALNPESLRTNILEGGIPAGTYLWLEYQGGEQYRIAPRPCSFEQNVPCKLAYIENGELHIEQTEIPMHYEGDPSLFKADMRFEDIEALFAEARRVNLSVCDAIIYAVQELCDADPQGRAHRLAIFNTVFLKRMCSPNSVSLLLYTQPCFEQLGEGYFRYNPSPKGPSTRTQAQPTPTILAMDNPISEPDKPEPVSEENLPDEIHRSVEQPSETAPVVEKQSVLSSDEQQVVSPESGIAQPKMSAVGEIEEPALSEVELSQTEAPSPGKVDLPELVQIESETPKQVDAQVLLNFESDVEQPVPKIDAVVEIIETAPEPSTSTTDENLGFETTLHPDIDLVPEETSTTESKSRPEDESSSTEIPARPARQMPYYRHIWIALRGWLRKVFGRTL